jgi:hypothetical protein
VTIGRDVEALLLTYDSVTRQKIRFVLAKGRRAANAAERYTNDRAIVSELLHARS